MTRPLVATVSRSALFALAVAVAPEAAAQRTLFESAGGAAGDRHGHAVAVIDDVNGDGVRDLVVGAPMADPAGVDSGAAVVLSGADGGLLLTLAGTAAGDSFGRDVAGAGDVDGDGVGDVVVAAHGPAGAPGYARVFSGATGAVLHTFVGAHAGDRVHSVAGGGDVDL
ncbi:MAG: integrin alpha, partial [Planctomycetota bacterium JB042]